MYEMNKTPSEIQVRGISFFNVPEISFDTNNPGHQVNTNLYLSTHSILSQAYLIDLFKESRSRIFMYCVNSINYLFTNSIHFFWNRF